MNQPFIYLASASPRRQALLDQIGVRYRVRPADIDESRQGAEAPRDYVVRLAREKAGAVAGSLQPDATVLAADTTVVIGPESLGKPRNRDDALAMLARLSGARHEVLTAVCVAAGAAFHTGLSVTEVVFREITRTEIENYWRTGEPVDKAGAYSIQGRAAVFVERIEGSYSGVMGLPLFETARLLQQCGVDVLGREN